LGDQPIEPTDPSMVGAEEASMVLMPIPYFVARLASPELVGAALSPGEDLGEVYLWAWDEIGQSVKARFFAPGVGVPEDPATGSAAVALAAHLRAAGITEGTLVIHQGDELGAPSTIKLRWDPMFSRIGGTVVRDEVRQLEV
ncbi:MAG: PhzF family phenazine biosynthesis protein, partial [Acidimicrobiia bacterium]